MGLADRAGCGAPLTQLGNPGGHVGVGDVGQLVVAPRRQDMGVQQGGVAVVGAGLETGLGLEPALRRLGNGDAAGLRSGPGPRHHCGRRLIEPTLGVDLA